jgi:polysaccharide export outer membrane protein
MCRAGRALTLVSLVAVHIGCSGHRAPAASTPLPEHQAATQVGELDSLRFEGFAVGRVSARRIAPRDLLDVLVFDAPELSRVVRVSEAGDISLPLVGVIRMAGKTIREGEVAIQNKLRGTYMLDPHVTIDVKEAAAQPIYVLGEVHQPGAFTSQGGDALTVLQAVAVARGLKPSASRQRAVIIRTESQGARVQIPVNLGDVVKGKAPDVELHPSDVLYVQKNAERAVAQGVIDGLLRIVTFRAVLTP